MFLLIWTPNFLSLLTRSIQRVIVGWGIRPCHDQSIRCWTCLWTLLSQHRRFSPPAEDFPKWKITEITQIASKSPENTRIQATEEFPYMWRILYIKMFFFFFCRFEPLFPSQELRQHIPFGMPWAPPRSLKSLSSQGLEDTSSLSYSSKENLVDGCKSSAAKLRCGLAKYVQWALVQQSSCSFSALPKEAVADTWQSESVGNRSPRAGLERSSS